MARFFRTLCLTAVVAMLCAACRAQAPADVSTLRVYVNRIQIPVLVLSQYGRPMRPMPEASFRVSVDGMGTFRPTRVRLEGDDPLAVAVIVDASDAYETTWRDLPKAVDKLLPTLHEQDRLTLYGLDGCTAHRFLPEDAPTNATLVHAGVTAALTMKAHVAVKGAENPCGRPLSMADMVAYVAGKLTGFAGRRMIVTVGAGATSGYASRMDELKRLLNAASIMLLPLIHDSAYAGMPMTYQPHRSGPVGAVNAGFGSAYGTVAELAEFSGGRVRYMASHEFTGSLADAVALARGRYILEFPRPDTLAAGHYRITVTDGHIRDFIRASGISVPVANAEEIAAARAAAAANGSADGDELSPPAVSVVPGEVAAPASAVPQVAPVAAPTPAAAPRAAQPVDPTDITNDLKPSR